MIIEPPQITRSLYELDTQDRTGSGKSGSVVSWVLSIVIASVALLSYLHFVLAFGVNVPYWDDWQLLDQARLIYSGQLEWWKLILSKHNEHMIGSGFLVQAWQLMATGFDYKLQLVTGVVLQAIAFGVLTFDLWLAIPSRRRPLWLAFSSLIWFSWCQHKDLLWPFQTPWFLVTVLLAFTLACLRRSNQANGGVWFSIAVAAAFFASIASFQGTLVWPAAAVFLLGSENFDFRSIAKPGPLRRWLVCAGLGLALFGYFWFKAGPGDAPQGGTVHVWTFLYLVLGIHGDFWGNLGVAGLAIVGSLMLSFVAVALSKIALSKKRQIYALPASLIVFGVCFVATAAWGRARFGNGPAADSHYTAYTILTYFGVLSIFLLEDATLPKGGLFRPITPLLCALLVFASISSYYYSLLGGLDWRAARGASVAILLDYRHQPDFVLAHALFGDPGMVRRNAEFLEAHSFGPFGDPKAVPESFARYTVMPRTMRDIIERYPNRKDAITRAWYVYLAGDDLRNAFNPVSDQFARDLLTWCAGASKPSSSHNLSEYLMPFAADYEAIKGEEAKVTARPASK